MFSDNSMKARSMLTFVLADVSRNLRRTWKSTMKDMSLVF
jgi:hypothetical protein